MHWSLDLLLLLSLLLLAVYLYLLTSTPKLPANHPPIVPYSLPVIGSGFAFIRNPTQFLSDAREKYGDEFLVILFGFHLFFTFSPRGLKNFYRLHEDEASFTEATRTFLQLKIPPEALAGKTMKMFSVILRPSLMRKYVEVVNNSLSEELAELGSAGTMEVFPFFKKLVHKIGLHCWAGDEAVSDQYLPRLRHNFEALDPEVGFTQPARLFRTLFTNKSSERAALRDIIAVLREIWDRRQAEQRQENDFLQTLHELYEDLTPEERYQQVGIDVFILHVASLANLYAALAWTLINVLCHPQYGEPIQRDVDQFYEEKADQLMEDFPRQSTLGSIAQAMQESIRLTQQSLTLRKVMHEFDLRCEHTTYTLPKGFYVATLLSVLNTQPVAFEEDPSTDPKSHKRRTSCSSSSSHTPPDQFDPTRYSVATAQLSTVSQARENMVSTFGHGRHACPGERFALMVGKIVIARLLHSFSFESFQPPPLLTTQMGAVGRASVPCHIQYSARE
eukprot:CAMPEP_0174236214 /NCGR_PEP_ID=MMETSP0417-20130205/5412_1 /TAXON_ID=242541 /ORGANISM="Mayorella sp, Strain BSH-02190019" /LENGTH=503 /DNA_ID=CAMNT_0015314825 /DNA_START=114 /DNA_END=1625 /DNA_ORIENTATION=-